MSTIVTYYLQGRSTAMAEAGKGWKTLVESVDLDGPMGLRAIRAAMLGRVNASRSRLAMRNRARNGERYTLPRTVYSSYRIVDRNGVQVGQSL